MVRFLFRLMATVALSVCVIMAVLDVTRTIAASALVLTPLGVSWQTASPGTLSATQAFLVDRVGPFAWDPLAVFVLAQPGFAFFAVLALFLYAIGHRPERRNRRFAVGA